MKQAVAYCRTANALGSDPRAGLDRQATAIQCHAKARGVAIHETYTGGDAHPSRFDENDYRLAAAALLVHAAAIDGTISDLERDALHAVVKRRFGLDDANTERLLAEATEAEQEAVDLYHFTSQLNRTLDEEGRRRIVEMMWEIGYADRHAGEFEENLIWRAADLLGVSSRERIELRHKVAERRAEGEGA
jgi:uncharacterized tellurite resistance protein B-like protein